MNLMFWKKKEPDLEEVMDEDSGVGTPLADLRAEDADQETPVPHAQGVKSWFTSIAQNLKTGRAAETEEEQAKAGSHAGYKSGTEAAPRDAHEHDTGDDESSDGMREVGAGLVQRMKERFAVFMRRFRRSAPHVEDEAEDAEMGHAKTGNEHAEEVEPEEESEEAVAARRKRKRRLLLIASTSTLSLLLLVGIGFVVWKVLFTRPVQRSVASGMIEASRGSQSQANVPSASPLPEVETLRKRNEELQMQLDALKSERSPEPSSVAISYGTNSSAVSATSQGDLALGAGDPQAAAKGLKEAIEAMNAATGDTKGAPHK